MGRLSDHWSVIVPTGDLSISGSFFWPNSDRKSVRHTQGHLRQGRTSGLRSSHSLHTIPHVLLSNLHAPPSLPKCCPSHATSAAQVYPFGRPRDAPQVLTYYSPEWDQIGLLCERLSVSFVSFKNLVTRGSLMKASMAHRSFYLFRPQLRNTPRTTKPSPSMIQPALVSYRLRITLKKALETSFSLSCQLWKPKSPKEVSNLLGLPARPPTSDFTSETSLHCIASLIFCAMYGIPDQIGAVESVKAASDIVSPSRVTFSFSNRTTLN